MLNDDELIIFLCFASGTLFATTLVFLGLWIRARERAIRARLGLPRVAEPQVTDLQHLVHAVDSIAVEVERISEGQRFTTQLLSERVQSTPQQKRAVIPERVITPH